MLRGAVPRRPAGWSGFPVRRRRVAILFINGRVAAREPPRRPAIAAATILLGLRTTHCVRYRRRFWPVQQIPGSVGPFASIAFACACAPLLALNSAAQPRDLLISPSRRGRTAAMTLPP